MPANELALSGRGVVRDLPTLRSEHQTEDALASDRAAHGTSPLSKSGQGATSRPSCSAPRCPQPSSTATANPHVQRSRDSRRQSTTHPSATSHHGSAHPSERGPQR